MTRVNWLGTVYTVRAALPRLVAQRSGHVVIVSSGAALRAFPQAAVYGATKAAQRAFAGALRHELAGTGVGVTTVFPGEIATRLHAHEEATMPAWYDGRRADPAVLVRHVLEAVEADRRAVVYPRQNRAPIDYSEPASRRFCSACTRRSAISMNARVAGERCALRRVMKAKVSYSGGAKATACRRRE
jgi:short-subunit dehydrogenase